MTADAGRDFGPFAVSAGASDAAAFRAALGDGDEGADLPLTYPMRWLAEPDVRAALMAMVPEADLVPVHESQSFSYAGALRVDEGYRLSLNARRTAAPDRLVVDALVTDAGGAERARMETILRLISTAATVG